MTRAALLAVLLVAACAGAQPASVASPRTPGPLGDTWTRDARGWHGVGGAGPSPRYFASVAYDAPRHEYVLFGGFTAHGPSDETWTWDGKRWTRISPAHSPRARYSAAMAYDPRHQVVLLFGGRVPDQAEGSPTFETWTWDGSDWTDVSPQNRDVSPRDGARMVTAGDRVLLYGGQNFNVEYFGDVRTWDGARWTRVDQEPSPEGRGNAAVAWNPADSSLFVFGGLGLRAGVGPGNLGRPLSDAWTFKGGTWTRLAATGPPAIVNASAIWDGPTHSVEVLFGTVCPNVTHDAWSWDGAAWRQAVLPAGARWGAAVSQDVDGNALVFGGSDQPGC